MLFPCTSFMADPTSIETQQKIYTLHGKFQEWARELPLRLQQRLPCELLAHLAEYLLSDITTFEIVNSLLDIQHIIERDRFHERLKLQRNHGVEREVLKTLYSTLSAQDFQAKKVLEEKRQKKELEFFDKETIQQLDAAVTDQQEVLQQAGLPNFHVTKDALEIQVQMCLLDFIIRSGKMICEL